MVPFASKIGYFVPWETAFSDGRELILGQGVPGIERIKYFDKDVDSYDYLVFPDVHDGHLVHYLRQHGYKVWGSGLGSELELLRWKAKERFKEVGIPVHESHRVHGIRELRDFFKEHPTEVGWFVKVSGLRGLGETWHARDYTEAEGMIDELEAKHGKIVYLIWFIIEASIPDCKELGYDGLSIDGVFPSKSLYGAEVKDKAYFGRLKDYSDLPEELRTVNDKLSPVLKELQYRNWFSTELRNEFCIDLTCRHASPAGECVIANVTNLGDVVKKGAEGVLVEPEWQHEYAAQLIICSEFAEEHWLAIQFP
jgi:hypothetical protein